MVVVSFLLTHTFTLLLYQSPCVVVQLQYECYSQFSKLSLMRPLCSWLWRPLDRKMNCNTQCLVTEGVACA